MQNETRRASRLLRYLPRDQRDEEQREMRLLRITASPGGEVRVRRSQLLRNCTIVLASTSTLGTSYNTQEEKEGALTLGQSKVKLVEGRNGYVAR